MPAIVIPAPNANVKKSDIVNNLTITSTTAPLSANMGKTLNDKLTRKELTSGDFNSLITTMGGENKYYYGSSITQMSNSPTGTTGPFSLDVKDMGSYAVQVLNVFLVNGVRHFERQQYWGGSKLWGAWEELALKKLIDDKIVRITGSITSTGSVVDTTVDLPSGYTYANSVIVGFGYATSASEYRHGSNAFGSNERVFARLTSQNKAQVTSNANGTVYFEVIIAKIA